MEFSQVLSRGFSAANRSVLALFLLFVLFGVFQGSGIVVGGLMNPEMFAIQPGQPPPPEFGMFMLYGCFSCAWILAILFVAPWVTGGAVGQLRDRIETPGNVPGSFAGYGGRCYLRLLGLNLILFATAIALSLIIGLTTIAILFEELGGFPMQPEQAQQLQTHPQPEQAQQLQTHPVSIASNLLGGLFWVALAIVFNLANAIVVIEYMDVFTAIGEACGFIRRRIADVAKLGVVLALLGLVLWGVSASVQFFQIHDLPILLALGVMVSVFIPYAMLLSLAWSVSLWLAGRKDAEDVGDAGESAEGDDQFGS